MKTVRIFIASSIAEFEPNLARFRHNYGAFLAQRKHDPVSALAYFDGAIHARSVCKQAIWEGLRR